ncbi:uncharacterized protein PG986_003787 [Apiospora aurea]|uniref:Rhodopsin domain-containing protein n=1 Tax=Apiospora aurea TaxID=335848 RepID=A0ABR1QSN8_9PEZI
MRSIVRFRARQIGIDDYLLILGVITAASFCGILYPIFIQDVWGRHQWNIPLISIKPWFFQGFFSAFSDIYVLVIPIVVVSGLQLPLKKKIGLTGIFLTGLMRGISIPGLYFEVDDHRWLSIKFEALCVAELNIGILCACIPVFFVLFKPIIQKAEAVFIYLNGWLSPHAHKENAATDKIALPPPEIPRQVPSGTLSGLTSFFRNVGHGHDRETEKTTTDTQVSQCTDLQSIDLDYHAQMRQSA